MRLAAALVASLGLAACSGTGPQTCPGDPVATFQFGSGARLFQDDPALAGIDPVPDVPDCPALVGYPATVPGFTATLSTDASVAALCRATGIVLYGQHTGNHYSVAGSTDGAVLDACGAGCAATLGMFVVGDVALLSDGSPASFQGLLVEELMQDAGSDCGTCLPAPWQACAARYPLYATP